MCFVFRWAQGQNANRLDRGTRACTKHAVVLLLQHTRADQKRGGDV